MENTADEDVGEGGVVQSQHHQAGEEALAPPHGHIDPKQGGQQAVGGAGNGVGVKQVLPHHGQGPLGHDVGENENGRQILPPGQVRSRNEEGEEAAVEDGHNAGAHGQQHGVEQGVPQVGFRHAAGKQVRIVDGGEAGGHARQVGIDGTGMDLKGVLHNGHNGGHGGKGEDNAQQQQDHIVGLGKKGLDLVQQDGPFACSEGGWMRHSFLLSLKIPGPSPGGRCRP